MRVAASALSLYAFISLTLREHASRIQQNSLVWRKKPASIHEHAHCITIKQDNRLMRPNSHGANELDNTKIYGRHKYLLAHITSTYYVSLYSKLERRVLLLVGWPLSSFLQMESFLNFSKRMHGNAHSDRLPCCSSLIIKNKASLLKKHATPSNTINDSFCFSHDAEHTL